ncbi:MAG: ABC transporter ATP-binding protein [Chlamydiales bacterium]|nr:ABC transporter ATP-binding protein [Chlamydiales bacterium]
MKKLLEVKNLSVSFEVHKKSLHAVREISFFLNEGERLGIVGESGCGKSATAKALIQLLPSHYSKVGGEVWFDGKNLLSYSERELQKIRGKEIGMIFQDPMTSLNPTLKIGTQIIEGYLRHHPQATYQEAHACAIEMLELVGIAQPKERANAYPHTLSGGMRQRAMIALALVCRPKLLLADEPTTSLDVTIQAQILDLMKNIQQKTRTSVILITHDLSVVAGFCDRVLVMYAGRIVEDAPVEKLFENPQHPYTQRLLQSIPRLNMRKDHPLIPIEGTPPSLFSPPQGCAFCSRCAGAMNICLSQDPQGFSISQDHTSFCWKHDPRGVSK